MAAQMRPKKRERPIYWRVARVVIPETGEQVGALVPLTKWDARAMRERKYRTGDHLRSDPKKPRDVIAHRKAHALAALMVDQHEAFAGLSTHDALKKLQSESGAACERIEYDLPGVGKLLRNEPKSMSFDSMENGEFEEVMRTIYRHIAKTYWPDLDEFAVEQMVEMYERSYAHG